MSYTDRLLANASLLLGAVADRCVNEREVGSADSIDKAGAEELVWLKSAADDARKGPGAWADEVGVVSPFEETGESGAGSDDESGPKESGGSIGADMFVLVWREGCAE